MRVSGPPDRLLSASSPIADTVELHGSTNDAGVMRMRPVPSLALPSGQSVELKPGGLHLMMMGLKRPLTPGSSFPLTLTFEHSPPITAMVTVGTAGAAGPEMDHTMHMKP